MTTHHRQIQLRQADNASMTLGAVLATDSRVLVQDFLDVAGTIEEVLLPSGMSVLGRSVPLVDSHDVHGIGNILGSVDRIEVKSDRVSGDLNFADTTAGREAFTLATNGHLTNVSIGYAVDARQLIEPGQAATVNGQRFEARDRPLRVVTAWRLVEVSAVVVPADSKATIGQRSMPTRTTRQRGEARKGAQVTALLGRCGYPTPKPSSDQDELALQRNISLPELARQCVANAGMDTSGSELALMQRATTVADFSDVLSDTGEVVFVDAMRQASDTTDWTTRVEACNFRPTSIYLLTGAPRLEPRSRGLPSAHARDLATKSAEMVQLRDYSSTFIIDAQDLRDDAVGALRSGAEQLANAAVQTKADLIYATLLANANLSDGVPLFDTTRGNDLATALSESSLATAMETIRTATIADKSAGLEPTHLIVAPSLEQTARAAVRSMELAGQGPLQVRVEPRLQQGVEDPRDGTTVSSNASSTAWFVSAGTRGISWATLEGQPSPEFGSWSNDGKGGWYGTGFFAKWPLDATAVDFRGLVRGNT